MVSVRLATRALAACLLLFGAQASPTDAIPKAFTQGAKWAAANPGKIAVCGVMAVGAVCVAAPGVIVTPALGAVGFGSNGVAAASFASGAQSAIGSVVAPSTFATLQSAAAGGYGVATVYPAVQVAGGTIASLAGASVAWFKSRR